MASPLQYGDPPRLGPFTVQARLHTAPAGFVYLAQAQDGRAVSLAILTRGAALDAAARDRFVTAVREAAPTGGMRGWLGRATGKAAVLDGAPRCWRWTRARRPGWPCRTSRAGRGPSGSWSP
ncbi:hypothetical protein OIE66_15550 [Nonomuraea sp. NBC_01738]|uniref:hypothetical protein n=1 Tax=Nonomuraea sp. NBC_01738 TaxID=2976003 RepID=UPI002E136341|nr:hypothetical protein OIE66_15550 [Nonomuraea sp. NBC_01738]